ncbi:TPA: 2-hydroxychromene-2-carboxylate isomerase [Pseudomonas aeruginosa]|nr:2-hydroxychromene-2-carboxylate isomerase [Pseudomonas aeruginosa]HEJ5778140.1 2-hydroxychromene-2-carboxylate isomerase [Pseudomonas aeruginosa]
MTKTLDFFFDVGSPASYLAWTQLPGICQRTGAELVYKPMLLGGVFQATGNASPTTLPVKGRYVTRDYQRFALRYGVGFVANPHFPINTLMLMRAVIGMQMREADRYPDFLGTVFSALWVDALNLNDPAVVAKALSDGGFNPQEIIALTNDAEVKAALRANTEEAVSRGVFGAPTMFIGDEMYFGQDRLDFICEALV